MSFWHRVWKRERERSNKVLRTLCSTDIPTKMLKEEVHWHSFISNGCLSICFHSVSPIVEFYRWYTLLFFFSYIHYLPMSIQFVVGLCDYAHFLMLRSLFWKITIINPREKVKRYREKTRERERICACTHKHKGKVS